jgi:hypothetical protein
VALPQFSGKLIAGEYMALYRRLSERAGPLACAAERSNEEQQIVGAR